MNKRILVTAIREFKATALTPAFIFAVVLFPAILIGGITLISGLGLLSSEKSTLEGEIAVADLTGSDVVYNALDLKFDPKTQRAERQAKVEQAKEFVEQAAPEAAGSPMADAMFATLAGRDADITLTRLTPTTNLEDTKSRLYDDNESLLAIVVAGGKTLELPLPPRQNKPASSDDSEAQSAEQADEQINDPPATEPAPKPSADQTIEQAAASLAPGSYSVFVSREFDSDARRAIESAINTAVVDERYTRAGYDAAEINALGARPQSMSVTVTADAETGTNDALQFLVPIVFMLLLWMSVMTGGQYLLMSTIEEKSSRVMEVLLSAISPAELLTGKIIGQGAVGLSVLLVYAGIGLLSADRFGPAGMLSLIPFNIIPWLIVYFLIAYGLFACLMAAIGSACTDIREAQSLMGPIMMLLMFPLILWFFIVENPNSLFATILSYIPFTTPFVMILRLAQTSDPVPMWQVITTALVGIAGVLAVGWAAVKIFRIGVLMYGKPPSFMGLLQWLKHG